MKIFIINGMPRSGKDTFCELCKNIRPQIYSISSVDLVKEIAYTCGWNGEKDLRNRKFLSDLKDLLTEWDNVPYKDIIKRIDRIVDLERSKNNDLNKLIIFIHVREPKEIQKFKVSLNAKTILIKRNAVHTEQSNHADSEVFNFNYDYVIENNGSIQEFQDKAAEFLRDIM